MIAILGVSEDAEEEKVCAGARIEVVRAISVWWWKIGIHRPSYVHQNCDRMKPGRPVNQRLNFIEFY